MEKTQCKGCNKSFKTSTLEKNDGNCGRCSKKDTNINITVTQSQQAMQPIMVPQYVPQQVMMQPQYVQIPAQPPKKVVLPKSSQSKKNPIPPKLRQEVWETNIGDKFWGNCFVCKMRIHVLEFACGHVVSEFKGGQMVLENLKVVCKSCNSKMGTQNMMEFKAQRYTADDPSAVVAQQVESIQLGTVNLSDRLFSSSGNVARIFLKTD